VPEISHRIHRSTIRKGRSSGAGVLREAADAYGDQQDGADVGGRHQKAQIAGDAD